jgi:hypothetical protein
LFSAKGNTYHTAYKEHDAMCMARCKIVCSRSTCEVHEALTRCTFAHTSCDGSAFVCCAPQVLFSDGKFQWKRLENLIQLAREGSGSSAARANAAALLNGNGNGNGNYSLTRTTSNGTTGSSRVAGLDLSDTVRDALRVMLLDDRLRSQIIMALTEDNKLRVEEAMSVLRLVAPDIQPQRLVTDLLRDAPSISRQLLLSWADRVLVS